MGGGYLTIHLNLTINPGYYYFYGRILVANGGGILSIITDLKNPTSGSWVLNLSSQWDANGNNVLAVGQSILETTSSLRYKIYG